MGGQGLLQLLPDRLKVLVMMTSLQNIVDTKNNNVLQWGHYDQNFWPIKTEQEALATHFDSYLLQQGLFSIWPLLFIPRVFWFKLQFFL